MLGVNVSVDYRQLGTTVLDPRDEPIDVSLPADFSSASSHV
jgi:hypothetical protein